MFILILAGVIVIFVTAASMLNDADINLIEPIGKLGWLVSFYASNPVNLYETHAVPERGERSYDRSAISRILHSFAGFGTEKTSETPGQSPKAFKLERTIDYELTEEFEQELLATTFEKIATMLKMSWGIAGASIISKSMKTAMTYGMVKENQLFRPNTFGTKIFAIFAFVEMKEFDFLSSALDDDVTTLINNVAHIVHSTVYKWGYRHSGQCNKNLGSIFLFVWKVGTMETLASHDARSRDEIFGEEDKSDKTQSNISASSLYNPFAGCQSPAFNCLKVWGAAGKGNCVKFTNVCGYFINPNNVRRDRFIP